MSHWSKILFLWAHTNSVSRSDFSRLCKNDFDSSLESSIMTRVGSCGKNVTRVESPPFSTWLESNPSHQKSWLG